jgi:hypothetical protein
MTSTVLTKWLCRRLSSRAVSSLSSPSFALSLQTTDRYRNSISRNDGRRGTSENKEGSSSSPLLANHQSQDKKVREVRHDEQHRGERRIDEEDREEAHARVLIPHRPPPHPSVIMECELSAILGATEERQEQLHGGLRGDREPGVERTTQASPGKVKSLRLKASNALNNVLNDLGHGIM